MDCWARAVINMAIRTAITEKGPTVISIPGDVAAADAGDQSPEIRIPAAPVLRPSDGDINQPVKMIDDAKTVAIFGGDGCRDARDEVIQLAQKLKAPVGYSFRGKQWLEHDNPNARKFPSGYGHPIVKVPLRSLSFLFSELTFLRIPHKSLK
jgi:pyruvate dehydrogenase (quinone)